MNKILTILITILTGLNLQAADVDSLLPDGKALPEAGACVPGMNFWS